MGTTLSGHRVIRDGVATEAVAMLVEFATRALANAPSVPPLPVHIHVCRGDPTINISSMKERGWHRYQQAVPQQHATHKHPHNENVPRTEFADFLPLYKTTCKYNYQKYNSLHTTLTTYAEDVGCISLLLDRLLPFPLTLLLAVCRLLRMPDKVSCSLAELRRAFERGPETKGDEGKVRDVHRRAPLVQPGIERLSSGRSIHSLAVLPLHLRAPLHPRRTRILVLLPRAINSNLDRNLPALNLLPIHLLASLLLQLLTSERDEAEPAAFARLVARLQLADHELGDRAESDFRLRGAVVGKELEELLLAEVVGQVGDHDLGLARHAVLGWAALLAGLAGVGCLVVGIGGACGAGLGLVGG